MPTHERRIEPCAGLRPWVSGYHLVWSPPGQVYNLAHFPSGESALVFRATGAGIGDLCAIGPFRRARYKRVCAASFYISVGLRPGRAREVLGWPLHELVDQFVPLEDLWNSIGRTLRAQLIESPPEFAVPLFEAAISRIVKRTKAGSASIVSRIVSAMDRDSDTSIDEHARSAGLSCRQLRHLFRLELGMGPKHYSRIARLRRLLASARTKTSWVDLALESGFYDQAHMIREFRDLLNAPPETFLAGRVGGRNCSITE